MNVLFRALLPGLFALAIGHTGASLLDIDQDATFTGATVHANNQFNTHLGCGLIAGLSIRSRNLRA